MTKRILVIEDEKEFADMVQLRLTLDGYLCDIAHHTLEGIRAFCTGKYDLMVLDLMVPGGGGLVVLDQREKSGLKDIPVIVLTGQTITPALKSQLQQLGISELLCKPYDPVHFLFLIEKYIKNSRRVQHESI